MLINASGEFLGGLEMTSFLSLHFRHRPQKGNQHSKTSRNNLKHRPIDRLMQFFQGALADVLMRPLLHHFQKCKLVEFP